MLIRFPLFLIILYSKRCLFYYYFYWYYFCYCKHSLERFSVISDAVLYAADYLIRLESSNYCKLHDLVSAMENKKTRHQLQYLFCLLHFFSPHTAIMIFCSCNCEIKIKSSFHFYFFCSQVSEYLSSLRELGLGCEIGSERDEKVGGLQL